MNESKLFDQSEYKRMYGRHRSGVRSRISPPDTTRPNPNFNRFGRPRSTPDILMEAGRLAADYLVYQGVLPPNVLNRFATTTRTTRNYNIRGRRRMEPIQWGRREHGFCSNGDVYLGDPEIINNNEEHHLNTTLDSNLDTPDDQSLAISPTKQTHNILSLTIGEVKNGTKEEMVSNQIMKQASVEDFCMQHSSLEADVVSNNDNDLLQLCSTFAKVPTRTRSSLTYKALKFDPAASTTDEGNTCTTTFQEEHIEEEGSSTGALCAQSLKNPVPETSTSMSVHSVDDAGNLDTAYAEKSSIAEEVSEQPYPELGRCDSVVKERGEKRALQNDEPRDVLKKIREWPSPMFAEADEHFDLHNYGNKPSNVHEESVSHDEEVVEVVDQDKLLDISMYPSVGPDSSIEFREVKQLFPSSFKICDLNLTEAPDVAESHDGDSLLCLPSTLVAKKEAVVDVDLSISNKNSIFHDYGSTSVDTREVVIVDVEDDSLLEEKSFDTCERKTEDVHSNLENFSDLTERTGDLPDAQDGYGLMISELLGNDISGCSSVQGDITDLHTEMDLHNGTGLLGDDDPIYLSLGEIPISMPDI
ncbi:hypothetical protein GIB67_039982 [Kingdonia uniflora]|uniref:Uncharacterized protein n=1 Tax=Kingdonia uniflora TaxID=39325 RepID=A0A7J7LI09_9MAGN|nr:hypothetical protein GIB67_039982 [Kingdonia uniflora]